MSRFVQAILGRRMLFELRTSKPTRYAEGRAMTAATERPDPRLCHSCGATEGCLRLPATVPRRPLLQTLRSR
jgi:hypothetical protein